MSWRRIGIWHHCEVSAAFTFERERQHICDQQAFERRSPALARVVEVTKLQCDTLERDPPSPSQPSPIAVEEENTADPKQFQ